jgi:hypothetical protein
MYVDLMDENEVTVDTGKDSIVIKKHFDGYEGGRSLDVTGFAPKVIQAGHIVIKRTSDGVFKPMPATDLEEDGVATVDTLVAGTGYTNGTYENVPLQTLTGNGKGALATVTVAGTVVTVVAITKKGSGYAVNDQLGIPGAYAGGTETTQATVDVATIADTAAAYGALPAGHTYAGIVVASQLTKRANVAVMTQGTVNPNAAPYDMTTILAAVKAALPLIEFRVD